MKPHLEKLLARQRAGNTGTLIGAYATETPDEATIYLQMIEGLLCSARVWEKSPGQRSWTEQRALELLAAESQTGGLPVALCGELGRIMRIEGLLPNAGYEPHEGSPLAPKTET